MVGGFGVGGQQTLGGATGIMMSYYPSNALGFAGTFSFNSFSPDGGDSTTSFQFAGDLIYVMKAWEQVNLGLVGNVSLGFEDEMDSGTEFGLGFGLRPEWFPSRNMSLFIQGGLVVQIIPETGPSLDHDGTGMVPIGEGTLVQLDVDLAGTAGFTVWFK